MYELEAFAVEEPGRLLTDLLGQAAATLVTTGPDGLTSTVLPLLYDAEAGPLGTLLGHVARPNPIVRDRHVGPALVVATGAAGYVSPSWYPAKVEHGKVVPTWDYVTVEAAGSLVLHDDAEWLADVVGRLTDRHEGGRPAPWAVADAPEDYVAAMLRRIVGLELPLDRLVGKAKLSQNRSVEDRAGVVAGLRRDADPVGHRLAAAVARPPSP